MTEPEICSKYGIREDFLETVSRKGAVGKREGERFVYDERDLYPLCDLLFLNALSFTAEEAAACYVASPVARERILRERRAVLLEEVHENERRITQIDAILRCGCRFGSEK